MLYSIGYMQWNYQRYYFMEITNKGALNCKYHICLTFEVKVVDSENDDILS